MEISALLPLLSANDVRLVGIGLEELGVDDFVKGEYFLGDLYLDLKKDSYKALGYKRFNICSVIASLFSRQARAAMSRGRASKIKNDLKGDGLQNGGLLIVKKGGQEVLMSYKQDNPSDHASNSDILKALGLEDPVQTEPQI